MSSARASQPNFIRDRNDYRGTINEIFHDGQQHHRPTPSNSSHRQSRQGRLGLGQPLLHTRPHLRRRNCFGRLDISHSKDLLTDILEHPAPTGPYSGTIRNDASRGYLKFPGTNLPLAMSAFKLIRERTVRKPWTKRPIQTPAADRRLLCRYIPEPREATTPDEPRTADEEHSWRLSAGSLPLVGLSEPTQQFHQGCGRPRCGHRRPRVHPTIHPPRSRRHVRQKHSRLLPCSQPLLLVERLTQVIKVHGSTKRVALFPSRAPPRQAMR